ncbi:MAG: EAL domain-containing protein [Zoogloeaceae bacterium]|nr:EAL domain-containing protein [Zoogloeaceae bacterium]
MCNDSPGTVTTGIFTLRWLPLPSSIRLRLLLASTVVQVVLLTMLLANSVRLMNEAATASLTTLVTQNAGMLHTMATTFGEQGRFGLMQDVLGELLAGVENEGLVYVRILDPQGTVLVSAGMPELVGLPPADREDSDGIQAGIRRGIIHVGRDLLLDGNQVGRLRFGVSVSVLGTARQAILEQGAVIAVVEILLTFALLSVIGYLLTRNLGRLLEGSKAIAEGRLAHRIPEEGRDELATLARHFNGMAATLQARVGELEETASQLRASEERYFLAMRGANDGLWDWDMGTGRVYVSPRFCEIAGVADAGGDMSPEFMANLVHPEDRFAYEQRLATHLKGESSQFLSEHRLLRSDGEILWVLTRGVALRNSDGQAFRMAGSLSDVHQRKQAEAQLVHDALYDSLTGLPNRVLFLEHLQSALGQLQRDPNHLFAVLAVNIDRFRMVNDSFGHAAGDSLLVRLGAAIRSTLRQGDVAARVGGDQFAVLLNGIGSPAEALRLAEALREHLARPVNVAGHTLYPKAGVGLAFSEGPISDAESLLRDADNALNTARQRKDDSVAVFHASMHAQVLHSLRLEADLRNALRGEGLVVHYQPIINLANGRMSSLEALARWSHPTEGMIPPGVFIQLAETLDLIHELDMWVLDQVCQDIRGWRAKSRGAPVPPVSINLSARQFARPDLASEIIAAIRRNGVAPEWLRLEVTESLLVDPDGSAGRVLQALREAGMPVLIDDFGTGYSALSYLHTIPCDVIKLDGSFVRSIGQDARLRAIVRHSIELAHDLGIATVAECIESADQAELLRAMGCDFGQGFHFSRPIAADMVEALMSGNNALKRVMS